MTRAAEPLLQVEGLTTDILTRAGRHRVVDDLCFEVAAGETLAIVGESGSGKSLAMLSITGLLPSPPARVMAGTARFAGQDLLALPPAALRRLRGDRIGMIFQEPMSALDPMAPVGDQIAETLVTHRGASWRAARRQAVELMTRVHIADAAARARQHAASLSGGMRQRIVIAAALACKPSLVIADEATTALDATVQAEILALLKELQYEVGCGVVFITHDMAVVRRIADRVLVMRAGRLIESGDRDTILRRSRQPYTRDLVAAASLAPLVSPAADESQPDGGVLPPVLAIEDLIVSFAARRRFLSAKPADRLFAVDGVSLSIERGETVALVGESGSGKTTLARTVLGLTEADAGRVLIRGRDVTADPAAAHGRVQYVFQDPQASLDPRFRCWRSVTEPLAIAGERNVDRLRARAAELLRQVDLDQRFLDRFPHELSGGQRQRLGVARALSLAPDLIIADEAVAALDAATRLQVLDLFETVQRAQAVPLLFITHDFAVVTRIAHRVAVMHFGRLVEIGPTAAVLAHPHHPYTRALIAAATGASAAPKHQPIAAHRVGPRGSQPDWRPLIAVADRHFAAI